MHQPQAPQILLQHIETAAQNQQYDAMLKIAESGALAYPNHPMMHFYAALAAGHLEQNQLAYKHQINAIALEPENAAYQFNAAVYASLQGNRNLELRAMLHYRRALEIEPNYADALWNYGELLRLDGHIEIAIECFERLIKLNTIFPKLYNRLVACYECLHLDDLTEEIYQKHILCDPTDSIGAWGYATSQIRRENFAVGFEYYNRRFECSYLNNAYHYPFELPFWDGVFKPNMTLLIHSEQGLGDEMMFASTFNELITQAKLVSAKIIIGCKRPLVRLFQDSFPDAKVLAHAYDFPMSTEGLNIDAHLPMGNLLARYRRSHDDFATHRQPYLQADPQRAIYYEQRIVKIGRQAVDGKRRLRIGLMWGTVALESHVQRFLLSANRRSIPASQLVDLADLIDHVEFISLQNQECGAEAALMPQLNVVDFSLDQADFYDTAALISTLDLVITIDTSVYHLAAAMGLETWVMLIKEPEWRFGRPERTESYWYANTRYFKQQHKNQWSDVIQQLRIALRERISGNNSMLQLSDSRLKKQL